MSLYVITVGPCVGKTSVISELERMGQRVIQEQARIIIEEGLILPWENPQAFQIEVIRRQKAAEQGRDGFCDRGLPDSIAYSRVYGFQPEKELFLYGRSRYKKVFLLDKLPFHEKDSVRKEDPAMALRIHEELERAYRELDCDLVKVPPIGIESRVELILKEIRE